MHRIHPLRLALGLSALLAALPACNQETSGGLALTVQLGPSEADAATCSQFGVETIRATLGAGADALTEEVPCGDEILFSDVTVGRWDLVVEAVDGEGFVVMDNGAEPERVEVVAGSVLEHTSELTATPAKVYVRWQVNIGGFPSQCDDPAVETKTFTVEAWDDIGTLLHGHTFECDEPADPEVGSGYHLVPDPDRLIRGNLLREVSVTVADDAGDPLPPTPRFMLDAPPGPGRILYLTVLCDDNACQSTGTPPFDQK
ncbi:MAG: hypothetical protein D6705_17840 [Deltaproteobacteria bacterium]|nr:MAG: hypothetical protein D6705_17840 [Deltaproteobacteria bacterium]